MNLLLFGATGMIGQSVTVACERDDRVQRVESIVRRSSSHRPPDKVHEIVENDIMQLGNHLDTIASCDACIYTAGVTALGLSEAEYTRITFDMTLAVAEQIAHVSPGKRFLYISGQGSDSSEKGRVMWARVKGRTENALLRTSLEAYSFRPGLILPLDGIRSRTSWHNLAYSAVRPVYPLIRRIAPNSVTTTRQLGHAMIEVAANGHRSRMLEMRDINAL
jgi:uncharacterized protein YbjT (DUF2867 family)